MPEMLVESLLDGPDDDLKAFASGVPDVLLANIAKQGLRPDDIDGVEVFGMIDDGEMQERVESGTPGTNVFGISVHKIGGGLFDVGGDFLTAHEAVAVAEKLLRTLSGSVPHKIHFIDET